jgi:hypothetical protein
MTDRVNIRVPIRLRKRGWRKIIILPDGTDDRPVREERIDNALVKALARAHRWQRLIDEGTYANLAEVATAERLSQAFVTRIARLALLAPELQIAILAGTLPTTVTLQWLQYRIPQTWGEQRQLVAAAERRA